MRILLFAIVTLLTLPAQAGDKVIWQVPDFPPSSIPVDGKSGDGLCDELVKLLIANWHEAEHSYIVANPKRAWLMMEEGQQTCYATAIRTPERERIAYIANAIPVPPLQLIVRAEKIKDVPRNTAGEVDLPALMATQLEGVLVEKRSYGARIDALVAKRPANSGLKLAAPSDVGGKLLQMLALGRLDYTIEYDWTLAYHQTLEPKLKALRTFPIAGESEMLISGVDCPRTPWGSAAITRIDKIIAANAGGPHLRPVLERWLTPESIKRHKAALDNFYRQRAKPTDPAEFR